MIVSDFIQRLDQNSTAIMQLTSNVPYSHLIWKQGGNWCIFEILEHLCISDAVITSVISSPSQNQHEYREIYGDDQLKRLLIDFRHQKISSPDEVLPKGTLSNVVVFENRFLAQREFLKRGLLSGSIKINNAIHRHPILGQMTISDWLFFLIRHSERHIEQIREILAAFQN